MASGLVKLYFGLPENSCQNNWGVSICFLQFRAFLLTKTAGLPVFWFDHENLAEFEVIREAEDPNLDDRVFVLPEFYGQCYEYLKTIEVKIVSPLVILQCYFWERQLPMRMNPTWSTILSGHYITVYGFRLHEEDEVRARILRLGGCVRRVLNEKTSILLVKEFDQNDAMVQDALAENVNVVGVGWLDEIWDRAHTIENGENDFLCEELFSAFPPPEEINVLPGIPVEDAKVNKWVNNITSQVSISTVRDSDTTANQSSHSNNNKENTTPQNSENHRNSTTNRDVTVPTKTPQTSKIAPQDLNRTVDSLDEELIIDDVVMTQDLSGGAPSAVTVIRCTPDLTDVQEEVVLDNSGNEVYDDEAERPKIDVSDVNVSFESDAPLPLPTEREIITDTLKSTSKRLEDFISSPTQRRLNKLLAETATQAIIVHQDERTDHVGDMEAEEISEVGMGQHKAEDDELSEVESIGSDYQRYLERGAEFSPLASPIEKVPYEKRHFVYTDKKRKRVRIPSPNDSIMSPDFNNENDNFSRSKLKAEPSTRLATALGPPITRRFGHNIVWQDKMFNPNLEMTQQPVLPPTQYSQFLRDVNQRKEQFDSMRQQSNGHN